ncbi:50S ribosomal protein L35 [Striga asiatica]|uniref:50S ribosomal protein L35 n=1 Tax=Striga asiatica TaxID=4170 RepID=A0A5A7P5Q1_STRAF|nr:50S ribosomal protein L35 [Striga asiatica]
MANTLCSFGLRTQIPPKTIRSATLPFTPFNNRRNLSLGVCSSYSIGGIRPLILRKTSSASTSTARNSQPLTVVCAKEYKMKTHKASAKRFRVTGSGKIIRRRAGNSTCSERRTLRGD